ncbi:GtrA family protein [archaeon]|jgi:putative flippase GtrA|nr:GtrA family protein [archaeon]MBT4416485.1 GtrA family protein [archaeon]
MQDIFIYFPPKQILKHAVVGGAGTVLNLGILYVMVEFLGLFYIFGAGIAFFIAVSNNFFWNKKWTFHNKSHQYKKQYFEYIVVSLMALVLGLGFLAFFVEILELWYMLAQLFTILIVGVNTFIWNKFWVFKK